MVASFNASSGPSGALAPRSDWSEANGFDHFVQFYDADAYLIDSLGDFVGTGLIAGDACIVLATEAHRAALDDRLRTRRLDVAAASATGQYVALDAHDLLPQLMVGDSPDPSRFVAIVGGLVASAIEDRPRVRIFGELVALLTAAGNPGGAIRLEQLWNDLGRTYSFALMCAYPMDAFGGEALAGPLGDVCATHSHVIPAESYNALADADERLREIVMLQQKAVWLEELLAREQIARAEAETVNRMKDEFLATVSHELRTPLNAIIGWSHVLRGGNVDAATAARALASIDRNAKSQAQLIEDILDASRIITGKLRLKIDSVDLAAIVNAAIDSVQLAADSKGIGLEVTLDPSARRISGDAGRLQQVVWNLLSNAIKFTPKGGRVEVRLERAGPDARLTVSDTGQGISAEFLPFIFDRFRQADGTSTRRHGGLGLGLAIVRHLVELHGGTVAAASEGEGCGAAFTMRLPFASELAPAATHRRPVAARWSDEDAAAAFPPLPSLEGVEVLLVDGDRDSLQMLTVMLGEYDANVHVASSCADALAILQRLTPDVLVSDLGRPDDDGYSLIAKVRASEAGGDRRVPAVALTAYVRVEDRVRALAAGFDMFVPKPVEPGELIVAIASLARPDGPDPAET